LSAIVTHGRQKVKRKGGYGKVPTERVIPTVLDVLAKQYPRVKKAVDDENLWNYSVYGPMSLDDEMAVLVRVTYGKKKAGRSEDFRLVFPNV
jgi:hypothetical protein